jgi:hypothetical protein
MMCISYKLVLDSQMSDIKIKAKKRRNRDENKKRENISSSIEGREVEEGQKFQY